MTNAGIYTRISLDRDGRSEAPERQEADCRAAAALRGWDVVDVYSDRDVSAFKRGASRPEFDRLMGDVRSGRVDVILVWKLDRLTRQGLAVLGQVLGTLEETGGALVAVQDGLDTSQGAGEIVAGVLAGVAKQESQNTSARVRASHLASAQRGRRHSGGSRQFGYDRDGTVNPTEAEVVREVVGRIVTGESLRQIAFDLNDRGVPTTQGKQWRSVTLGQMIRSPRLAGLRVHHPVGGERQVFEGDWEPVLTPGEHDTVLGALARPLAERRSVKRHLLVGVARCGLCGGNLKTMGFRMHNGQPFERYQCVRQPGEVNCGRVAVTKRSLDAYVTDQVLGFLARSELRPLSYDGTEAAELERLLLDDTQAMRELTNARFVARTVSQEAFDAVRRELQERIDAVSHNLDVIRRREEETRFDLVLGDRASVDAWWERASDSERREVIARALARIVVNPAKHRGGNVFDTSRIALEWRWDLFIQAADRFDETAGDEERSAAEEEFRRLSEKG